MTTQELSQKLVAIVANLDEEHDSVLLDSLKFYLYNHNDDETREIFMRLSNMFKFALEEVHT
jgi:adenosyl cobinamide kinase/adenosyl cobinamide phosphate guanylyltransferase